MASKAQFATVIVTAGALGGALVAWLATRTYKGRRPTVAVRIFELYLWFVYGDKPEPKASYPWREAFLATWFLSSIVIGLLGLFVWLSVSR